MLKFYSKYYDDELEKNEQIINNSRNINVGNSLKVYQYEKERVLFNLLLKPTFINHVLGNKQSSLDLTRGGGTITMLELACGNASNSRAIIKGLNEMYPNLKFKILLMDISSKLLNEALNRFQKFQAEHKTIELETEAIQLNFHSVKDAESFVIDYKNSIDFIFSIKFLHNTNVKINKKISFIIASLLKTGGVFVTQFYNEISVKKRLKMTLMYLLGYKYSNSTFIDRYVANYNLKKNNLILAYSSISKNTQSKLLESNHFYNFQIENYYIKK